VSENSGKFVVYKKRRKRMVANRVSIENEFTYDRYMFTPNNFDMYLFSSDLKHSVEINESEQDRISISFNSFYNCVLQETEDLSLLNLMPE